MLGALCCLAPIHSMKAADLCSDLRGRDTAAHLEYLRGDRSKLATKCIVTAIEYVGAKRYTQAIDVLVHYLDYHEPDQDPQKYVKGGIPALYPAVDALYSVGKPAVPELITVISDANSTELVRQNAAYAVFLICGVHPPVGIEVLVSAAHAQADPIASLHLMDQARWLAGKCIPAWRNECGNAVLK